VLKDKAVLAIAAADPQKETELGNLPDLPPAIIRKQGQSILAELRRANSEVDGGQVQFRQAAEPTPPDAKTLKNLSGVVSNKAQELGIPAEVLSTKRDLAALLRGERDIRILQGWRMAVIGEPLLEAL
jgi:ribonuclease D